MTRRTPEQEAARRARSDRDHGFPKCPCGNVAGRDQTHCRACREGIELTIAARLEAAERFDEMEALKARVDYLERVILATADPRVLARIGRFGGP